MKDEGSKDYRWIGWFAFIILALCVTGTAQAQTRVTPCSATTQNNEICITWSAVTQGTQNETLTGVTYRVEKKAGSGTYATASTGQTGLQFYDKNLAPGTYTYRVYANCTNTGCIESFPSDEASKSASANPVQPNKPVIVIAALIREGKPPSYRIVYTVRPRDGEYIFVAPEAARKLFASK